jgi:alpha-tubulin suppressor-like RCC1 family protein
MTFSLRPALLPLFLFAALLIAGCDAHDATGTTSNAAASAGGVAVSADCALGMSDAGALAEIAVLRDEVDDLETAGSLNSGQANALRNKLDNAAQKIGEGNYCPAAAMLRAFREQVGDFLEDGVLTESEATPLLDASDRLIGDAPPPDTPPLIVEGTITAGLYHTCGLTESGSAYCWGSDLYGELGAGMVGYRVVSPVPVEMPAGVSFSAITAGRFHTVALSTTGAAYAWGRNTWGQLGDGTTTDSNTPVAVEMPAGVSFDALTAGAWYTVGLTATGTAYAWGDNRYGQLGDGTTTDRHTPVAVEMPPGVSFVGIDGGGYHTVALTPTGAAYAWGYNREGEVGDGTTVNRTTPVAVAMPSGIRFSDVGAGDNHTVALTSTGAAYAWGRNADGQLGDGTTTYKSAPVPVGLPAGIRLTSVRMGYAFTLALTSTGTAYAWGNNEHGQLGDGTTTDRAEPVAVEMPVGVRFAAIVAGRFHALALSSTGTFYAWGNNEYGQLGDGTTTDRLVPTAVNGWPALP